VTCSFLLIPDNVQFVAAVNRGSQFSGTYGIDAAQLDRFCPLSMDYPPEEDEVRLLAERHPRLGRDLLRTIVAIANKVRQGDGVGSGVSFRATDMACTFLEHPVYADTQRQSLPDILKSAFCGRIGNGRWNEVGSEAGAAWAIIENELKLPEGLPSDGAPVAQGETGDLFSSL
jgi:nitric oxide reductase NorQ protein